MTAIRQDNEQPPAPLSTMHAMVLSQPGGPENLVLSILPMPQPPTGSVRIAVRAFGLNRFELHTRLGLSEGVAFPRVLGIEAVGVIDALPEGESDGRLALGRQAATLLGGMGRFDGGYAEHVVVPRQQVILFDSSLPWAVLGAVPETQQTAHGSLTILALGGHSAGTSPRQSPNDFADGVHGAAHPKTALWLSDLQALRLQWVETREPTSAMRLCERRDAISSRRRCGCRCGRR